MASRARKHHLLPFALCLLPCFSWPAFFPFPAKTRKRDQKARKKRPGRKEGRKEGKAKGKVQKAKGKTAGG
jgi:hypothetical protein